MTGKLKTKGNMMLATKLDLVLKVYYNYSSHRYIHLCILGCQSEIIGPIYLHTRMSGPLMFNFLVKSELQSFTVHWMIRHHWKKAAISIIHATFSLNIPITKDIAMYSMRRIFVLRHEDRIFLIRTASGYMLYLESNAGLPPCGGIITRLQ